ncbi:NAD(P)/FAD-dependent oxidoreductase [Altericista sp. CCNU0014]|uniref:NAD(P)/FAD-dependent oxidoreductase n=1 Tax=Altericista sp. CCNU0014 TaxID=3082949 RepID=UPI00384D3677
MQEIFYTEVPTPDTNSVKVWLQRDFQPAFGAKAIASEGCRVRLSPEVEWSIFVWSVQRTTYLKIFRWSKSSPLNEQKFLKQLRKDLERAFPVRYPTPPPIDLTQTSIFEGLEQQYPLTVRYFRQMPKGEADLARVYWWEQRWRNSVKAPQQAPQVIFQGDAANADDLPTYDLIYLGGALGVIHAAVMAQLGYRVLLIERLPFGRMHREWNISRGEFQNLIDLGLFTAAEFEGLIAREYADGFHKFFDANNPPQAKAAVLHTPTVLNIAVNSAKLLQVCGEKLRKAGGEIWDYTEFSRADVQPHQVKVQGTHLPSQTLKEAAGKILIDAMGTASPIAWQLNGERAFDSVCPTVGAVLSGIDPAVWDSSYGDVLNSHGDISRGRQLIWELFPGPGSELTFYLFHYHQVHPENPGSLLEMYEDFFTILPEYRRCDLDKLTWIKPTFGYIPGHFSANDRDRTVAFDRLVAIGDAASMQSPLVFTGFGSMVRNLPRLTDLLDTALRNNLFKAQDLNQIRAYQSNIAVTWLFSRGMMVPTGRQIPPQRVNSMLNTFFGILAGETPEIADGFVKDRFGWLPFNRMAIKAAFTNPALLYWIWDLVGPADMLRWLQSYWSFTVAAFVNAFLKSWFPAFVRRLQPYLEPRYPRLWLWLLALSYSVTYSMGKARIERSLPHLPKPSPVPAKAL